MRPLMDDAAIRLLVARLARPNRAGGHTIERASILAEGEGAGDVIAWITDHGGEPESVTPPRAASRGLHFHDRGDAPVPVPRRWILPPGTLDQDQGS